MRIFLLKLRNVRKNKVLAGLHAGNSKPNWFEEVEHLKPEIAPKVSVGVFGLEATFTFICLVADLAVKSTLVNMFQHNGYFGCHVSKKLGRTFAKTHAYYPFSDTGEIRSSEKTN